MTILPWWVSVKTCRKEDLKANFDQAVCEEPPNPLPTIVPPSQTQNNPVPTPGELGTPWGKGGSK